MLPQLLVQNALISKSPCDFTIDWEKASPIVDVNFYYTWRLIDESYYYRTNQYPWTLVKNKSVSELGLHEYCITSDGEYKYCVNIDKNDNRQIVTLTPTFYIYNYDEFTGKLVRVEDVTLPVYATNPVFGLQTIQPLSIGDASTKTDSVIQFNIDDPKKYIFNVEMQQGSTRWLQLATDVLFGRIIISDDGTDVCIAHVPVTITRCPNRLSNSTYSTYIYTISIPNQNFPNDARLELY